MLTWKRSLKRKYEQTESFTLNFATDSLDYIARVEIENECAALRKTVSSQEKTIQEMYIELDEERNASSSATNEAMSMILRLQRENAEIDMEARQFKRFAEEKMGHDQQKLAELDDLLYKQEEAIKAGTYEVQVYKHRMLSFGLTEAEIEGEKCDYSLNQEQNEEQIEDQNQNQKVVEKCNYIQSHDQNTVENYETEYEFPPYDYPPLKCMIPKVIMVVTSIILVMLFGVCMVVGDGVLILAIFVKDFVVIYPIYLLLREISFYTSITKPK